MPDEVFLEMTSPQVSHLGPWQELADNLLLDVHIQVALVSFHLLGQ